MARFIPNENSWVGFTTARPGALAAPTAAEIAAATDITSFVISVNAQTTGNSVPTPNLDSLFETSISGTVTASFTADFYRDTTADTAWTTLPRGTVGFFFISRYGGSGANQMPIAGQNVEVWPVKVTARTASALTSNTAQTFTLTCAIPEEAQENAVVVATAGVPSAPTNLSATAVSSTSVLLDFDQPAFVGAGLTTPFYKIYVSSTAGGSYTEVTTNKTVTGTTATLTSLTTATTYFYKVAAVNAAGTGPLTNYVSVTTP